MKRVIGIITVIALILSLAGCAKGAPSEITDKFYASSVDAIVTTDNYLNGTIDAKTANDLLDAIHSDLKREEDNCPSPSFARVISATVLLIKTHIFTGSLSISSEPKDDEILAERNELAKRINYTVKIDDAPSINEITLPEPGVDFSLMDDYDYTGWQDEELLGITYKAPAGSFLEEQSSSDTRLYNVGDSVLFSVFLLSYDPELGPDFYYDIMRASLLQDNEMMTNEAYKNDFLEGWHIEGVRVNIADGSVEADFVRAAQFVVNDDLYFMLCIVDSDAENKYFREWEMFLASVKPLRGF